jgi:release factor glutamine methyltransferase
VTLQEALNFAKSALSSRNVEDAGLESEVLLRHALGIDRTQLYLTLKEELTPEQEKTFRELLERRLSGVPLAYVVKHREFYGLDFYINQDVLIPRPETELLVEKALELAKNKPIHTIADVGTGSGIIAVTLAVRLPDVKIYATDISEKALAVALFNAEKHGVVYRITFLKGDLVRPIPEPCDLIVANLPYVKRAEITPPIAAEPHQALDGGKEGLDVIKRFCREVKTKLTPGGYVLMEIGRGQSETVKKYLLSLYPDAEIEVYKDMSGIERVVEARIP